jgi:predicted GNAT superfamily acetyltransferase
MTVPATAQMDATVSIRHLHTRAEFDRCCELEEAVWGGEARDLVPSTVITVIRETGGQVLGAFLENEEMVGFTLGMAALHDSPRGMQPYIHSHMTAVLAEHRDKGIGRLLKLFQRQDALARGIRLVEWTFDPLEMRNAHFNLMRLGVVVRQFRANFYGITTSHLHAGMPTDRLLAEWWIAGSHARRVISGAPPSRHVSAQARRILVPKEMPEWRKSDVPRALAEQTRVREQFLAAFRDGYVVTAIEQLPAGGQYVLEPYGQVREELECESDK